MSPQSIPLPDEQIASTLHRLIDNADDLEALASAAVANASRQQLFRVFIRSTKLPFAFHLPKTD